MTGGTAANRGLMIDVRARVGELELQVTLATGAGPLVVIGPNGAGKTTLLSLVLGSLPVERGRIEIEGTPLVDTAAGVELPLEHRRLGYVPQDYALFPHLTVKENIAFALHSAGQLGGANRPGADGVASILHELAISHLADRRPRTLSGGERQRAALARALCVEPRALLLDEPLAALDIHARREVRGFLAGYLQSLQLPTLVVTHDPADARELGTEIAVLEAGRITQRGTWNDLASAPASKFIAEFVA